MCIHKGNVQSTSVVHHDAGNVVGEVERATCAAQVVICKQLSPTHEDDDVDVEELSTTFLHCGDVEGHMARTNFSSIGDLRRHCWARGG